MASAAIGVERVGVSDRFFLRLAIAMALVIVVGFSGQVISGRSSFAARPLVHLHAVVFMSWVALFVIQSWFATRGPMSLHRPLGWIGGGWSIALLVVGFWLMIDVVRRGTVPFFFVPQQFLIANPATLVCFGALTMAAIRLRKQSDWHSRLHICGMAAIIGPGFGRIFPMPLLIPYAFEIAAAAGLIFPAIGAVRDRRIHGTVHPAWWWGIAAITLAIAAPPIIASTPAGDALYRAATAGSPGASVPGSVFAPPPALREADTETPR